MRLFRMFDGVRLDKRTKTPPTPTPVPVEPVDAAVAACRSHCRFLESRAVEAACRVNDLENRVRKLEILVRAIMSDTDTQTLTPVADEQADRR